MTREVRISRDELHQAIERRLLDENKRLRAALRALVGEKAPYDMTAYRGMYRIEDKPSGWRCSYCGMFNSDMSASLPNHAPDCPIAQGRAALGKVEGE